MQHVVQVGNYAWLSTFNGAPCVTTSGAHAERFADQAAAQVAADAFTQDRAPALLNSTTQRPFKTLALTLPVTVVLASELDARLNHNTGDRGGAKPAAAQPADKPAAAPKAPGVTRQIYQWVLDHPFATKADALAAFPSANPSTVGVQFGAARKQTRG